MSLTLPFIRPFAATKHFAAVNNADMWPLFATHGAIGDAPGWKVITRMEVNGGVDDDKELLSKLFFFFPFSF